MNKMIPGSSQSQRRFSSGEARQSTALNLRDLVTGRVQARGGLWQAIESEAHLSGPNEVSDAIQYLISDVEAFAAVQSTVQTDR